MSVLKINSLKEINAAAKEFLSLVGKKRVFALYGAMGVGKTTFVKAICDEMGVEDTINSPTFSIVNEYHTPKDDIIYHFDFYRIEDVKEAYDFGYEDYFYGNAMCFIEWPEKIESILPNDTVEVLFKEEEDGSRSITIR
ncbi:tRNA (adenosine(37)-N6)-threonylcarbamoyltransferase complex ATPase subunit type 1 TsaE [Labilibaculum sp. A4]|uniref:tRNA (adenosine(37)-N6)-threonylcarbamoyltransferase complex ATPase subunit type 1 TsaE n=1 Tax=Labilibaculum euxinus TaxID=2686357 RepID=UPI000F61CFCA|nr:tRNA (adenosine(37)-N6)-threonylcarbamoyltransferase complex ATPase subunit type 1 TsaE [Labilibaculum euxinus]MDQ1772376.1 tRNA (adenosine(37)-N6)-threonylcarbamoyltransferase complex ATPase subunit type 1 TsaE [Labilibaculum euxinus]MWN78080.1 tRNA (adenosine(37)-N6)-threonylcarbamoyltransferase complex ATPase subunit type 1 TsaE [Labilibaculum euxinus]